MDLLTAFTTMLSDVTCVNASARQVTGILIWLDRTRTAVRHAMPLTDSPDCLTVTFAVGRTHRTWRMSSKQILAALTAQAEEAAFRRLRELNNADREDRLAVEADRAAVEAQQRADAARSRAASASLAAAAAEAQASACTEDEAAAGFLAQAAAWHAEAAAAAAEAAAADAEAARHRAAAEQHRDNARKARELAKLLMAWMVAARDAHATGAGVVAVEDPIARRVHDGIQAAGGLAEVPGDKRYLTRDGALAGGGGTIR